MPQITPYDPTNVKNMVVGVADYRKAKAGEAFENLARGLGQVRNQVAANAEQRIAMNANLAGQAIGSIAHLLQQHQATSKTQNMLNQQKVAQTVSNFNLAAGNAAKALQNSPGAADPSTTNDTFSKALDSLQIGADGKPIVNYDGQAADSKSILTLASQDPDLKNDRVALGNLQTQLIETANKHKAEMTNWKFNAGVTVAKQANQVNINNGVKVVSQPNGVPATDTGNMSGAIVDATKAIIKGSQAIGLPQAAIDLEIQKANQTITHAGFAGQIDAQARSEDPGTAIKNLETIQKTIENGANLGFDITPESAITLHGKVEATINAQVKNLEYEQDSKLAAFRKGIAAWDVWRQDEGHRDSIPDQKQAFGEAKKADLRLEGLINANENDSTLPDHAKNVVSNRLTAERESNSKRMASISGRIDELKNQEATKVRHQEVLAKQTQLAAKREHNENVREAKRVETAAKQAARTELMDKRQEALAEGFSIKEQMAELNPATQQDKIMRLAAQLSKHADDNSHVLTPTQAFSMHATASKTAKGVAAIKVVPPQWYQPWGATTVEHLDITNPKEAQELLQKRDVNIAAMKKMQTSLTIQNEQEARAAAVKAAGGITEDQEDTWNNTVTDLTNKWEKGQLTEDAMKFKIGELPKALAAQKPKLPQPKLPPNLRAAAPIPLGQMKDVHQAPKAEAMTIGEIQPGGMTETPKQQPGGPEGKLEIAKSNGYDDVKDFPGLQVKGNIDLGNRVNVHNQDGSHGSEYSTSFDDGKHEVVIPTIYDGEHHTTEQAIEHYKKTGEHMGKFARGDYKRADEYAQKLHERKQYVDGKEI